MNPDNLNQQPDYSPNPQRNPDPSTPGWVKGLLVVETVILVVLAGVLFWFFLNDHPNENVMDATGENTLKGAEQSDGIFRIVNDGSVVSDVENIKFDIPDGWKGLESVGSAASPASTPRPLLTLKKEKSSCVIQYADKIKNYENLIQVSLGDRVYSANWQFDTNWYVAEGAETKDVRFSRHTRQYLNDEFRYAPIFYRSAGLSLYSKDGSAVPDECNSDMNDVLETVQPWYERYPTDQPLKGMLWVAQEHVRDADEDLTLLLHTPRGAKKNYKYLELPPRLLAYNRTLVYDDKFYAIAQDRSAVIVVDPFSGSIDVLESTKVSGKEHISSIYIQDGDLYYLVTDSMCLDMAHRCVVDFYRFGFDNSEPVSLAQDINAATILEYREEEDAFYFAAAWGDAGCFEGRFSKFDDGGFSRIEDLSACSGDPDYEEARNGTDLYYDSAEKNATKAPAVYVEDGSIRVPDEISEHIKDRSVSEFQFVDN